MQKQFRTLTHQAGSYYFFSLSALQPWLLWCVLCTVKVVPLCQLPFWPIEHVERDVMSENMSLHHNNSLFICRPEPLNEYRVQLPRGMERHLLSGPAQIIRASWPSAVVFAVCSSATQQSVFVTTGSLMTI